MPRGDGTGPQGLGPEIGLIRNSLEKNQKTNLNKMNLIENKKLQCFDNLEKEYGTHPIPLKYLEAHNKLSFWEKMNMKEMAGDLMKEEASIMEAYN